MNEIEKAISDFNFNNICPLCFGTGKLKAMQMAMTYDGGTVREKDTTVKCNACNSTGRKKDK